MTFTSTELQVADTLRHLALNEEVKAYVLENPPLYQALLLAAMRFIGGETLQQCEKVAKDLNAQGFAVTIDYMGESTRDVKMAKRALQEFLEVIQVIANQKLHASVSLDLSHIGMIIDPDLAYKNACTLAQAAQDAEIEVMISMEGSDRTATILEIHEKLCERFETVGITLQAYLHRTPSDLTKVLQRSSKIRLVKGAYDAPIDIAKPRGEELDNAYKEFLETLLQSRHSCSIATHDITILSHAKSFIETEKTELNQVEFEMLKGVTPDRLQSMRDSGYRTRVYLPYGREWYLYLCNRLAEYPSNAYQVIIDSAGLLSP
jgi:proline dehydrogenase